MADLGKRELVGEILAALEKAGEIEKWVDNRVVGPGDAEQMETYRQATEVLLAADPPQTDRWEHLLFATATRSAKSNHRLSREACNAAIEEFSRMIEAGRFSSTPPEHLVTLASTLTMVLSAQRRLRQPIEIATRTLCEHFPQLLPTMAERCQDIWQRHGQMSGLVGLYLWDNRKHEWRLNQDFKPYRPSS